METEGPFKITIEKEIHPEGASEDAAAFLAIADLFRRMADSLRREKGILDQSWEGKARDRFFEVINPIPNRLDAFAETLEDQASFIEYKTVTIQETIWITPDQII